MRELQIDSYIWQTLQEGCLNMHSTSLCDREKNNSVQDVFQFIQTRGTRFPWRPRWTVCSPKNHVAMRNIRTVHLKRRLSRRNIATHLKGDLTLQDTIILDNWIRLFCTSCLIWFRIDFCLFSEVTAHYCLLPRHFSYCQQYAWIIYVCN